MITFTEMQQGAKAKWAALKDSAQPHILVGDATCGRAAGGGEVVEALRAELKRLGIEARITGVGCIGLCYAEPMIDIVKPGRPRICYAFMTPEKIRTVLQEYLVRDNPCPDLALGAFDSGVEGIPRFWELPMLKPQVRIVLKNCGLIDPTDIDHYLANDGYQGLSRALQMKPEEVVAEVKKSGLRGRGGAGFPTFQKWEFCRSNPAPRYLVCNFDEGDPGAFMNRSLVEGDPHAVVEGLLIAGYAIGCVRGFVYGRAEYPLALERLRLALRQAKEHGLLGENILGSGFSFDIEIREGAGAFVCGEETALLTSLEGKRGMPRPRPPFPAVRGLWGRPTNINNVETLGTIPHILRNGGEWYAKFGSERSKGTKTFCLVGKVVRTGLVEVPLGTKLGEVVFSMGGGLGEGKEFKAAQTGGPSGGCLPASVLELPIDYESLTGAGSIMGSGGLIIMDQDNCPVDMARYFLSFTTRESCGKCVPCRVGTRQMQGMLEAITHGEPVDLDYLEKLARNVNLTSLCGLGQTAPNPVLTTLRYFRQEYEAHIREKRCPALVCKPLINYYIDPEKCQACLICYRNCPVEAIIGGKNQIHVIDQEKCTKCGTCLEVCPPRFRAVTRLSGVPVPQAPPLEKRVLVRTK